MKQRDKVRAGKVSAIIILCLEVLSMIQQGLGLDFLVINSIVALVEDASVFMTFICISFGVIAIKNSPKAYGLMGMCVVDIILINHLYSDKNLLLIPERLKKLDPGVLFLGAIVIGSVFFVIYKAISEKKNMEKIEHNGENIINITLESENGNKKEDTSTLESKEGERKQENVQNPASKNAPGIPTIIVYTLCAIVICWGILDYLVFNVLPIEISRPKLFNLSPDYLYYAVIMCMAILFVLICINIILKYFQKDQGRKMSEITFKISVFFAIIMEFILYIFSDKIGPSSVTERFLSAVSDNEFLLFLIPIIVFIILQTSAVIFLNLIGMDSSSDLAKDIENRIENIQKGIIIIAFGIIEGCVGLFDFIPDFFSTIGYLLLDKKNEEDKEECKEEGKGEVIKK